MNTCIYHKECLMWEFGLMMDLLWSDPKPDHEIKETFLRALGKERICVERAESDRGAGVYFGKNVSRHFLNLNNLDYIIRSHEPKDNGYEVAHDGMIITIYSAPDSARKAAYITISGKNMTPVFNTFEEYKGDRKPYKPLTRTWKRFWKVL